MQRITINTSRKIVPKVYAYSTTDIPKYRGWVKIGYTDRQTVESRVKQQGGELHIDKKIEWQGNALFEDDAQTPFTDHDFHSYLSKLGIERTPKTEWFHVDGSTSKRHFSDFRFNMGVVPGSDAVSPYQLREEQERCVRGTADYAGTHTGGEYLWNAKPRFGKTLSVYDFIQRIGAETVLIVTNRPAIANSWYSDYEKFLGPQSGYRFVSETDSLKGKKYVLSREDYGHVVTHDDGYDTKRIDFVSLQDLKGSKYFGGEFDKLLYISQLNWDVLVIDEAHEGVDTYKTDVAFNYIKRKFTLHLSGTPFKALASEKFPSDAIFNWTYADEQTAKRDWSGDASNPYEKLPKLNMFTYQMSEIIRDQLQQGIEIDGEVQEFAFDLNEFFETDANGRFKHEEAVDQFLDALTRQEKFPFSTPELRSELKHTFWLLNRIDSARALVKKLNEHPVFRDYYVVPAFGDGRVNVDDQVENQKSYDRVRQAIDEYEYTITVSVGQLTTGVTIPEWTAVLMLSSIRSPSLYMQAAFRAQNPCLFPRDDGYYQKENAYVFDFDPARTLIIFEQFANDLSAATADGRGDELDRERNVRELLNFFPVIGEDENGEMIPLDAEKVLSIPRRIKSREVVKSGFRNNYLFSDALGVIFHAPQEIIDIVQSFTPEQEPSKKANITPDTARDLSVNPNGDVELDPEYIIGTAHDVFGDKIFGAVDTTVDDVIQSFTGGQTHVPVQDTADKLKEHLTSAVKKIIDTTKSTYGGDLRPSTARKLESSINTQVGSAVDHVYSDHKIAQSNLQHERDELLETVDTEEERQEVHQMFEEQMRELEANTAKAIQAVVHDAFDQAQNNVIDAVETDKREREKKSLEDKIKDHLRGFSRTIPSFLMAYGDETVTLATFDTVIPDEVFKEVTSITLEQFRKLRDGGEYTDEETGELRHYPGLFDKDVFNASVKLFLQKRRELADYFEEAQTEDIFDYIPPQKTNQIFTPKRVVRMMVDMLEEENPGCFDRDDKTFIDLYMKSGLYVAEIVKRLYRSDEMKRLYPDRDERLKHIFAKQVYGLAPTEIIYRIAMRFVLGFDEELQITRHNLRKLDALEYAKNGTLEEKLDEEFGM